MTTLDHIKLFMLMYPCTCLRSLIHKRKRTKKESSPFRDKNKRSSQSESPDILNLAKMYEKSAILVEKSLSIETILRMLYSSNDKYN